MKSYLLIGILFGMILLAGCAQTQTQEQQGNGQLVGNDKDAHGCIPSAGYSWCEPLQQCIRPWETNCTAEVAPECTTVADCGMGAASCVNGVCSQYDEHGCVPDGGYTWCEPLQQCIRPWETNCTEEVMPGSDRDEHGCIPSAGYSWCEATQKCYRPWEENCTSTESAIETKARTFCGKENIEKVYVCGEYIRTVSPLIGGGSTIYDSNGNKLSDCPMVNPEYFSEVCKKVILESNCVEQEIC
jgi:hypothetical protein